MKKRKIIFGIFLLVIFYMTYWTLEPYSLNPFAKKPTSLSKSEINLTCERAKGFSAKADSLLNFTLNSDDFLGVSVGVYSENCGTWLSTAGFLNKKKQEIPNKSSLFRIASISKPMTAIAILQLYEKGKIELDVPIQNYLPNFPKKNKGKITIRQLLMHKSGIPHYKSKLGIFSFNHYDNCIQALDKFKNRELLFEPGTSFTYSSFGYVILGAIIEKTTGKLYQDYMKTNIWEPAKMTLTSIEKSDLRYNNKADLYIKLGETFIRSPKNDLSYMYSGGGIQSTSEDLLKFGKAILSYKLISQSTTELMMKLSSNRENEIEYTLGWDSWISTKNGRIIEHNGAQIGASSYFRIYFDKKIVVTTLTNNLNSSEKVRNLSLNIADIIIKYE